MTGLQCAFDEAEMESCHPMSLVRTPVSFGA